MNSFVRFLEESSAWKKHYDFVWPLDDFILYILKKDKIKERNCFPSKSWDRPYLCFIIQTGPKYFGYMYVLLKKIVNFTISKRKPSTLWPLCVLPLVDLPAQNCLSPYLPVLRDWMPVDCYVRYHSRFFVPVGHESTHATIGNRHIFSLYHVIVRHTKTSNNLLKDYKVLTFKVIFQY